jgi:DHA1 family tetracycline resistance protein-like MFS transporter
LLTIGFNFFTQFFQVFLIDRFGFSLSSIGNTFAYIGMWIVMVQFVLIKPLARWFPAQNIVLVSLLGLAASLPLLLLADQVAPLLMVLPLIAVTNAVTQPTMMSTVSSLGGKDIQGRLLGINQSIQSLAQAIPPMIAGLMATINIQLPVLMATGLILVSWLLYVGIWKRQRQLAWLPNSTHPFEKLP